VAQVLNAEEGVARLRRAGFTDAKAARPLYPAFQARGFATFAEIGRAPVFETAPVAGSASA